MCAVRGRLDLELVGDVECHLAPAARGNGQTVRERRVVVGVAGPAAGAVTGGLRAVVRDEDVVFGVGVRFDLGDITDHLGVALAAHRPARPARGHPDVLGAGGGVGGCGDREGDRLSRARGEVLDPGVGGVGGPAGGQGDRQVRRERAVTGVGQLGLDGRRRSRAQGHVGDAHLHRRGGNGVLGQQLHLGQRYLLLLVGAGEPQPVPLRARRVRDPEGPGLAAPAEPLPAAAVQRFPVLTVVGPFQYPGSRVLVGGAVGGGERVVRHLGPAAPVDLVGDLGVGAGQRQGRLGGVVEERGHVLAGGGRRVTPVLARHVVQRTRNLSGLRRREGHVVSAGAPRGRLRAHGEAQVGAVRQLLVRDRRGGVALAVDGQVPHVDVALAGVRGVDHHVAAGQMQGRPLEQRGADDVVTARRLQRVQAQRAEDPPGGSGAVVLVAGVALPDVGAEPAAVQRLADRLLRLVRLLGVVVHVRDVVRDLVGDAPLTQPQVPRLAHLVDGTAVRPRQVGLLRGGEVRVQLVGERLAAAVQPGQAFTVLGGRERLGPAVGLGVVVAVAPDLRVVAVGGGGAGAVRRPALEEPGGGIVEVGVAGGAVAEVLRLLAQAPAVLGRCTGLPRPLLGHRGDRGVVDVAVDGPGVASGDVVGDVAEERRALQAVPADAAVRGTDGGVLQGRVVRVLGIDPRNALGVGVGEGRVGVGAGHHAGVAGRGPGGYPAAVAVLLHEAVRQLAGRPRPQQGVRGPCGPEGVPETGVDEDLAVGDLGTGPRGAACRRSPGARGLHGVPVLRPGRRTGVLVRRVRVEVHPVQVRVERGELVVRAALDLDDAEPCVPGRLGPRGDLLQGVLGTDLQFQVLPGLVDADEGGGDAQGDGVAVPARVSVEGHIAGRGPVALGQHAAARHGLVEGAVHVHTAHARGDGTGLGPAGHGAGLGVDRETGAVVDVVEDELPSAVIREGEAEDGRVVGRCHVGAQTVGEGDAVVVRKRRLVLVPERQRAGLAAGVRGSLGGGGHDLERLPVAHPDAGLVAGGERLDLRQVLGVVLLVVAVEGAQGAGVGLRRPEVEAVRDRRGGEVVAARVVTTGLGSAGGDDPVGRGGAVGRARVAVEGYVVDPAADVRRALRTVVGEQDPVDGTALRDVAEVRRTAVPLQGEDGLGVPLGAGGQPVAVSVAGVQAAEPRAVRELQVDGGIGARVVGLLLVEVGEEQVRQLGVRADPHVDVGHDRGGVGGAVGLVARRVVERVETGETHVGLRGVGPVRSVVHDGAQSALAGAGLDHAEDVGLAVRSGGRSAVRLRIVRLERTVPVGGRLGRFARRVRGGVRATDRGTGQECQTEEADRPSGTTVAPLSSIHA